MSKDFICNSNGKIRDCESNIAKMNIFEYLVFRKFFIRAIFSNLLECADIIKEGIFGLFALLANLLVIILFPISFPIAAYMNIKKAKKVVEQNKNWRH